MSNSSQSDNQPIIGKLPLAEIIDETTEESFLEATNLSHKVNFENTLQPVQNQLPENNIGIPKEIADVYPNLKLHSIIGDSLRFHSVNNGSDDPFFSVFISPKKDVIQTFNNDEGFSDLPDLETHQENENNIQTTEINDGFDDIPVLIGSENPTVQTESNYPSPAHEAEMLMKIGNTIGVAVKKFENIGLFEVVVSDLSVGIPLLESFRLADTPEKKLHLLRSLVRMAKDLHGKGFALEGAEIQDFVVSQGNVYLVNLTVLLPLNGSKIHPLKLDNKIAPELVGHCGQRTLGGILYGLGLQFLSLAYGGCPVLQVEKDNLVMPNWNSIIKNPSPELGRLLGSLLANNPESRLGACQEIGLEETWNRLEDMVADWINSEKRPKFRVAGATTIGVYRKNNEDSFGIVSATKRGLGHGRHLLLGMVSDGMGGGAVGEIASTMTIESLSRSLDRATEISPHIGISSLKPLPEGGYIDTGIPETNPNLHLKAMADALITAHHEVREAADKGGDSCSGMGATAVAIHISEWDAVIGHVGDSRAYLVRNGTIKQLTIDHSAVQKLVSMGLISPAEAAHHSRRHELSQAIGGFDGVVPDVISIKTMAGDSFLLCSDGVTNLLNQHELLEFLSGQNDPETIANNILAKANSLGAPDNATALIIQVY